MAEMGPSAVQHHLPQAVTNDTLLPFDPFGSEAFKIFFLLPSIFSSNGA
jgi:hypothetical protein